jgi:hypothetical protein
MVSVPARRDQVLYAHKRGLSLTKSCTLLSIARSALRYESRMRAKDAPVIEAMRRWSAQFPRFGYRRIKIYLEREGLPMSFDRTHRSGSRMACRCRANGPESALRRAGQGRSPPPGRIRSGRMTSCSMPARTASS